MSLEKQSDSQPLPNLEYTQRIDRVVDYLRQNLDRQVKLAELAKVACFSEFHLLYSHERRRKESGIPSEIDRCARTASRVYSGYQFVRRESSA